MLRELVEYPNSFIEPAPGSDRIETGRFTLCLNSRGATVQRQRFATDELDAVVEEVRALLRDRARMGLHAGHVVTAEDYAAARAVQDVAISDSPDRPALVTQAGAMSRPILAALGFRAVGRVEMLVDDFGERS